MAVNPPPFHSFVKAINSFGPFTFLPIFRQKFPSPPSLHSCHFGDLWPSPRGRRLTGIDEPETIELGQHHLLGKQLDNGQKEMHGLGGWRAMRPERAKTVAKAIA
jgi:hypothetical protein